MTDKKSDTPQGDRAPSKSAVLTTPTNKRVPPEDKAGDTQPRRSRSVAGPVALVLALIAVGLSGAVWVQQQQTRDAQTRMLAQLSSNEAAARSAATRADESFEALQAQQARIAELESQLGEAGIIIQGLDEALRTMTDRGSELVLLNDIDHLATIAQQQLQLGGNVRNAIVAMESAQAQLARANRPSLASLMQTVNGDLDRLRAASTIDVAAFSRQLEELAMLLTEAPLIIPDDAGRSADPQIGSETQREQPAPTTPPATAADDVWWKQAWNTTREWSREAWDAVRQDLGQFVDVRRVDDANALLMSPDQAARFRENLRTRVMTAQLALMMRQPEVWNTETQAIVRAIESRYDDASPLTRKALRLARSMADASIDARLPTVDNTLQALNTLREEQTRGFGSTPEADTQNGAATNNGTGPGESAEPEFDSGADTAPESGNGAGPDAAADADPDAGTGTGAEASAGPDPSAEPETGAGGDTPPGGGSNGNPAENGAAGSSQVPGASGGSEAAGQIGS